MPHLFLADLYGPDADVRDRINALASLFEGSREYTSAKSDQEVADSLRGQWEAETGDCIETDHLVAVQVCWAFEEYGGALAMETATRHYLEHRQGPNEPDAVPWMTSLILENSTEEI